MHHAYVYEGSRADFEALKARVAPFVAEWHERFGIDEARTLVAQAALKREGESVYLIGVSSITTEAQQALLKLFEEPREGVRFVLVAPHGVLLPTLRSRMLEYPEKIEAAQHASTAKFLKASGKERSDIIAAMLKDDEGVKERVREFLDSLEAELHKKIKDPAARAALGDLGLVRDYLRDRSPSIKMLLEHVALSVPTF
jgi:hypothetical protein